MADALASLIQELDALAVPAATSGDYKGGTATPTEVLTVAETLWKLLASVPSLASAMGTIDTAVTKALTDVVDVLNAAADELTTLGAGAALTQTQIGQVLAAASAAAGPAFPAAALSPASAFASELSALAKDAAVANPAQCLYQLGQQLAALAAAF
jgi:hypothetical protein